MRVDEILDNYKIKPLNLLKNKSDFYEGTYLNHVKWNPKKNNLLTKISTFFLSNGYLLEIDKTFNKNNVIMELGCAGGWDYLGHKYNMIGLDLSEKSITQGSKKYNKIICDARNLILEDEQLDGVVSSYFWEHINEQDKKSISNELYRVLKPKASGVFLFDVKTENKLISSINKHFYEKEFILKDDHVGYHTINKNINILQNAGFIIDKTIGMERGVIQSRSVYIKLKKHTGLLGIFGKTMSLLFSGKPGLILNIMTVRLLDLLLSKFVRIEKSRIVIIKFSKK